jgi:hypothetical protein
MKPSPATVLPATLTAQLDSNRAFMMGFATATNAATRGVGTIKHEQRFFSLDFSLMPFFGIMLTASL